MKFTLAVLFAVVSLGNAQWNNFRNNGPSSCPPNESFTTCHNPCTEKKCPSRNPPMISCLLACQTGCGCSKGFVRNNRGQCVRPFDCPRIYKRAITCATMKCENGFVCQDVNGRGKCVPEEDSTPSITCANVRCGSKTGCAMVMSAGCSSMKCAEVSCVDTNPCASTMCPVGSECILRQVQCFVASCEPIAECFKP